MVALTVGREIENLVGGYTLRLMEFLGRGGFGAAFRAQRLTMAGHPNGDDVCVKVIDDADVWHGEAYFAGILRSDRNVVRMIDAFPTMIRDGRGQRMVFVIEMEVIPGGTVKDACEDGRMPWPEDRVARKIRPLLQPLATLHRMGVSHRDMTPRNVFVGSRSMLKLGDFGIAKAGLSRAATRSTAFAPAFAPRDVGAFWRPSDDMYQVGLLMASMLFGQEIGSSGFRLSDINQVTSGFSGMRDAVKACLRVRSQRVQSADDLLAILP